MFKCTIVDWYGPYGGMGGYGSETRIGMSRSPKQAVKNAERCRQGRRTTNEDPVSGICGGGVPVMRKFTMERNGKILKEFWD